MLGLLFALLIACLGGLVIVWLFAQAVSLTTEVPVDSTTVALNQTG